MRPKPYYKKKKGVAKKGVVGRRSHDRERDSGVRIRDGKSVRHLAGHDVDVVVMQCSTGQHCAVGVERRADDRGRAVVVKETRVRFEGGEVCAVRVEGLDFVAVGAPRRPQLVAVQHGTKSDGLLTR